MRAFLQGECENASPLPSLTRCLLRFCALVADVHRTLLRGGWAGNPRPHLRLLYEAMPLAHIAHAFTTASGNAPTRVGDEVADAALARRLQEGQAPRPPAAPEPFDPCKPSLNGSSMARPAKK